MLPEYLAKARPNPKGNRAPWYANTAPTYAGIFLWVAFYKAMAGATLAHGGLGALPARAWLVAGMLCYALYYRAPGHARHEDRVSRFTSSAARRSERRAAMSCPAS